MRLILEVWLFGVALAVTPYWTKWYLPINPRLTKYLMSGEFTVSILWLFHFSVRFPFKSVNVEIAKQYLQK